MNRLWLGAVSTFAAAAVACTASAQSTLTLSAPRGKPTGAVVVSGSGFSASEAVDLYFDTTDTQLVVSSSAGALSGLVTIPASAQPGDHSITAVGRRSGDAAQIAYQVTTPWNQFGYGASHRGLNPYENTINTGNVGQLGEVLQIKVGSGATPAVANGAIYISGNPGVQSRYTSTGALRWTAETTQTFYASPTLSGSRIYVGSLSGNLYDLNAVTGKPVWTVSEGSAIYASAAVVNGIVYIGFADGTVRAYQASSGTLIWTYTTTAGSPVTTTPAVVDGVVYVGSYDENIYALNATTGALIFKYAVGEAIDSSPVVVNGVVYLGCYDDKVYAVNAAGANSGTLLWSYTTGGAVVGTPAVANGTVYIGSDDGKLYALDANSGSVDWSTSFGVNVQTVAVANGVIYVTTTRGSLYMLAQSSGAHLASAASGATFLGGPAVSDGVVYVSDAAGYTYAYGLQGQTDARRGPPLPASLHPDLGLTVRH